MVQKPKKKKTYQELQNEKWQKDYKKKLRRKK